MRFFKEFIVLLLCAVTIQCLSSENRIKIAIVDTGIKLTDETKPWLCADNQYDFTSKGLQDVHGHGTNVAGLIVKGLDVSKYCLVIMKYWHDDKEANLATQASILNAWKELETLKVSYVNMSLVGELFSQDEYNAIKALISKGTKVVVSSGNNQMNLDCSCFAFPACYNFDKNFYVVGAIDGTYGNVGKRLTPILSDLSRQDSV